MTISKLTCVAGLCAAGIISTTPAIAGELENSNFFGSVGLSFDATRLDGDEVAGTPTNEPNDLNVGLVNLSIGTVLAGEYTVQFDARAAKSNLETTVNDSYQSSFLGALRVSRDYGAGTYGVFAGGLHTVQDDDTTNTSDRYFAGVEAAYPVSGDLTILAQLGYLDGGVEGDGEDSIRDAIFGGIGLAYVINSQMSVSVMYSGAGGTMDSSNDQVAVNSIAAQFDYRFNNPAWSAYARVEGTRYDQYVENDVIDEKIVTLGLNYRFGGSTATSSTLHPIVGLDRWVAQTGGPLE